MTRRPRLPPPVDAAHAGRGHARSALSTTDTLNKTNRDFIDQTRNQRASAAPGGNLFRDWQQADAQASAARHRVREGSVADGHGISDADVCDALLKERRAGDLAAQLLQHFGAARKARHDEHPR